MLAAEEQFIWSLIELLNQGLEIILISVLLDRDLPAGYQFICRMEIYPLDSDLSNGKQFICWMVIYQLDSHLSSG